jgi:hypothetical protein
MSIQQLSDTATQTALSVGGGGGGKTIPNTIYFPNYVFLNGQNPVQSTSGTILSPFEDLSPVAYYFSGIIKIEMDAITSPPNNFTIDIGLRLGTSQEGIFSITLPSIATSYATIPFGIEWSTYIADGLNPSLYVSWTPNGTYASVGGGASVYLSGVMIPLGNGI